MRERMRKDHAVVVHKYNVELPEVPQALWDHARAQNDLWNALVEFRLETLEAWRARREEGEVPAPDKKAFWDAFYTGCRERRDASGLYWTSAADVHDRFITAHREQPKRRKRAIAAGNEKAMRDPDFGAPRFRGLRDGVQFLHRFTSGGLPLERCSGARQTRFRQESFLPEWYADNRHETRRQRWAEAIFRVDETAIPLRVEAHRPLPEGAILKSVRLVGEYQTHHRTAPPSATLGRRPELWRWALCLTLEVPPGEARKPTGKSAAIDLGWRRFADYVRVGVLRDSDGNRLEICLPWDGSTSNTRRHGEPGNWDDVDRVRRAADASIEEVKATVKEMLKGVPVSEEARGILQRMHAVRARGLGRLLVALEGVEGWQAEAARTLLAAWQRENDRLQHVLTDAMGRLSRRRQWVYGNLAAWLSTRYDRIAWEEDLAVSEMAQEEQSSDSYALKNAGRYRQMVAMFELRQRLAQAVKKRGGEILPVQTANTTRECHVCGGIADASPDVLLRCENGHTWDQDENAAQVIYCRAFSHMPPGFAQHGGLREEEIPQELRKVLVPMGQK